VVLAFAVFVVFRGALGLFFAQEDFRGLAVAKGLLPRHATLWRYVSVQTFMDLFYPVFGEHPWPYHLTSLALHAANAFLLFRLMARRLAPVAALVAASFFATHPALFTALYWQSARADLMATTFALCTVALVLRQGRERWLAVPAFALALLSKESVILLPPALWLIVSVARSAPRQGATRDLLIPALCAMSLAFGLYLLSGAAGIGVGTGPAAAYALDFGRPLVLNLLTYSAWTIDLAMAPSPLRFLDVRDPGLFGLGAASLLAWGLGCLSPRLRERGWVAAGACFLLLLIPVLPLRNHTYHYLLCAPIAAAAWCVGVIVDRVLGHMKAPAADRPAQRDAAALETAEPIARRLDPTAWILAGACLVALTWNGASLTQRMETRPMRAYPALRADPIVSRAIVAENVINGLHRATLPPGTRLVFLLRERLALQGRIALGSSESPPPAGEIYPETNLRVALFEGHGVRALVPGVTSVTFAGAMPSGTTSTRYVVYAPTGEVEVFTRTGLDSLVRSAWITRW
jgi:hypothetical protein